MKQNDANHFTFNYQEHHHLQLIPKQSLPFSRLITLLPLRGRAGVSALFLLHYFTFNNQQHHRPLLTFKLLSPFPWLTTPLPLRGGAGGEALFPLHYFTSYYQSCHPHNCFTTQLGTSCSFDSPGLARNEPTLGKR